MAYPETIEASLDAPIISHKNKSDVKPLSRFSAFDAWWNEILSWFHNSRSQDGQVLDINGDKLTVEVADDLQEQQLGLGYRDILGEDEGMLFIYDQAALYRFWMKGMRFPLDMIWIRDGVIVDITRNVPVAKDPEYPVNQFAPSEPANWVLEVNAGWAERHKVVVGEKVALE